VREYAARKRAAERVNTAQFFASRETEADSVKLAKLIGRPLNSRGR
jgi:ribosomal protein L31E